MIAKTGLKLFIENGYEATTLDAIAAASGISRRTFFYYLKSKEEVLLAHESGNFPRASAAYLPPAIAEAVAARGRPEDIFDLASMYETKESVMADRILRSIEHCGCARKRFLFSWRMCWPRRCTNCGQIRRGGPLCDWTP